MRFLAVLALALVATVCAIDIEGPRQSSVESLENFPGYMNIWRTGDVAPMGGTIGQLYSMDMAPLVSSICTD
jgi:hypothetical protein